MTTCPLHKSSVGKTLTNQEVLAEIFSLTTFSYAVHFFAAHFFGEGRIKSAFIGSSSVLTGYALTILDHQYLSGEEKAHGKLQIGVRAAMNLGITLLISRSINSTYRWPFITSFITNYAIYFSETKKNLQAPPAH